MRNVIGWKRQLVQSLRGHWNTDSRLAPSAMCEIELGLTLLETILPGETAEALWVVLTGYPFPAFPSWTSEQRLMIGAARHLLSAYKSPFPWKRSLERYQRLDGRVRGYEIDADGTFRRLPVSVCAERWDIYAQTLRQAPAHSRADVRWAKPGDYGFYDRRRRESVTIPEDLPLPGRPKGHDLSGRTERMAISISWDDLRSTAAWMDSQQAEANLISPATGRRTSWERDIQRVELHVFDHERTSLRPSTVLTLDGMTHMIGMVSSGKSTLMDVLAVWAARHGLHITIVVGDVVSALSRAELFRQLGLAVAPILGSSNRERHLNRLHRVTGLADPTNSISMQHSGFDWLSTACPLDGLRSTNRPVQMGAQPCLHLIPVAGEDDEQDSPPQACPLYSVCPFHQAQRDLVDARIWIATPASLVYTRIPPQLNGIRLRFAELVYRRSDLVIVDEADQVQIQLDHMFSPSQILVSRSHDAWLNRISNQVNFRINQEGRGQLGEERVAAWYQAHDIAQRAASHLYARLLSNAELQKHIAKDYFTAWLILEKLALQISGAKPDQREDHGRYRELLDAFQSFIDDPLGERTPQDLVDHARQIITVTDRDRIKTDLQAWLEDQLEDQPVQAKKMAFWVELLEFGLTVGVLSNRLDMMLRDWRYVEQPLQLEIDSSLLFHRPPTDYSPVLPTAPMGDVLAFQYLRPTDGAEVAGDLRFFRCVLVGRWLLLHLHELYAGDGIAGPNVLLLSGTSWAGAAPGQHVQVPVHGILRAPQHELDAIGQSTFRFELLFDQHHQPIRVSGKSGEARLNALRDQLNALIVGGRFGQKSRLEQLRERLPTLRRRVMLLVGSYDEAREVYRHIISQRSDLRDQVLYLVPDDERFESGWQGGLQRGMVSRFAQGDAWILIAPLLAVERGHNILNDDNQAAIGAAYFLIRPHPRPDDLSFAIHAINRWAVDQHSRQHQPMPGEPRTIAEQGAAFRQDAYREWRYLLHMPMIYTTLHQARRDAVTWMQLVVIWQVVGRLVRGGVPAQVFFVDDAFNPSWQDDQGQIQPVSLLQEMERVLHPYFTPESAKPERALVEALYEPLYLALRSMRLGKEL